MAFSPAPSPDPAAPDAAAGGRTPALGTHLDNDALVQAIVWLTRHHGRERSAQSLLSGVPLAGALGPDQAVRVLREAGFNAGLIQRRIADIHSLLLPAVLLLRNGDACIVVARNAGDNGIVQYDVVMPGPQPHVVKATEVELGAEYTGITLVASPRPQAARAAGERSSEALRDPGSHWLWGTLRRFIPYYRSALVAALLSNVLMLGTGLVTSVIFDKVIPHQAFVTLWALATGAMVALVFDLVARQLRSYLIDMAGKKTDLIIGSMLFRQSLGVRMEHRPASAGSYAHQLAQIEVVREFFAGATLSALSDLPFVVIFVAMTFIVGGQLGWVLVLAIPLILGLAVLIQSGLRRSMSANMEHQADLQGVLVEAVEGLEDIKAAGAQGRFLRRYEDATAAAAESAMRARALSAFTNNLTMVAQQLITIVMLVWGVYLISAGDLSGGALIGAVMFAGRAVGPLGSVVSLATRYQGARAAMVGLNRLMELPTEREAERSYVSQPQITGRIGLHEVGFAYPATSDAPAPKVLKGVNLRFEPGERVAILGRIGSGKSTILRLLAGLYQPTEGMVEVDGIDLRQIDPADYRARVGFVSQEPRLFNGSLRDNVLLGRSHVDASRLAEVARLTGLDRMIAAHPQGWELPVGEMGGLLSGGQRQLVALARCLVTQPQILLMDEPTSSMDAQSEVLFLRQLKDAVGDRTLIMVTHRPAVLDLVTRVAVVDAGKLVMDGPKAQALAALSGNKPAQPAAQLPGGAAVGAAPSATPTNVHLHPAAQPVQRQAAV
jgi:ATP-binding cassette subfamily C protein LapB